MSSTNNYVHNDLKELGSPLRGLKTALGNLDLEKSFHVVKNHRRIMNLGNICFFMS